MYTTDEIRQTMEKPEETRWIGFIDRKLPDRKAASERYYIVQEILYDWHSKLNDYRMNTREMPEELRKMYDQAVSILFDISNYERKLSE